MDNKKDLNERVTEDLLEELFVERGYKNDSINIEKQKSKNSKIKKLLKNASKSGNGKGAPEHIITFDKYDDFVIVSECKADDKFHESKDLDKVKDYAVDGVIHYMSYLSSEYNVIGIAASGMNKKELKISNFFLGKGLTIDKITRLQDENVLELEDYIKIWKSDPKLKQKKTLDLMKFSKTLHNYMRDYAKLAENEKPLLVSAILLALEDEAFQDSYKKNSTDFKLANKLYEAVKAILEDNDIEGIKQEKILSAYAFVKSHPELTKKIEKYDSRVLLKLVEQIDEHIMPFIREYHELDIVGKFYGEFLRYTGGDKKSLGIVLTPHHIGELFADLAELTVDSKVLDTCAGTSGFLISAAMKMIDLAGNDSTVIESIKKNNLIGVEQQPNMFALSTANMLLRNIGMERMYLDNSFELKTMLTSIEADVGMINPPYAQKGEGLSELEYIEFLLSCVKKGGTVLAIIPISCAITQSTVKERLLKNHTLEAVMTMPNDLFYPVGTYTCIMVFTAKKPHPSNKDTWFAYWKEDGFVKTKTSGRIDMHEKWAEIKNSWVDMYTNRDVIKGISVKKRVTAFDEWCAEAYLETNYDDLSQTQFEAEIERYVLFKMANKERMK